ncbi:MAG: phosphoglycolate phosphatase [Arenimonas sp.]
MSKIEMAPVILFDLDGTLVDSAVDLLNALNVIVQQTGKPALSLAEIRPVVSKGARAMLAVAFPELGEEQRLQYLQPFLDCYQQAVAQHSTPFPDIETVLNAIEASGSRWGIVTNKPFYLAKEVVQSMGWTKRSSVLIGGDTLPRKKPDPDQLFHACELLAVQASDCIYVGDDERDVVAARHAGMKSVAAIWGYREAHDDPNEWRADVMAEMPLDLLTAGVLLV